VHRDVKPANILVAARGGGEHAYLTDFGLTKRSTSDSGLTATGEWVGTLDYVAPEQVRGEQLDGRADIYALGCVLYETLTGQVPFMRDDELAKLWAHISDPPPSALEVEPEVPRALAAVAQRCMHKDPDQRFATAGEMGRASLAAVPGLVDTGARARAAAGGRGRGRGGPDATRAGETAVLSESAPRRWIARRPAILSAALLLLACMAAIVLLAFSGDEDSAGDRAATPGGPPVGRIEARIPVGDSPAGVTLENDSAWVANEGAGTVTRIDLETRRPKGRPIPVGKNPSAISGGLGSVWVANLGGGTLTRIDARSGRVLQTIPVGHGPVDVAVGRESVWVSTQEARVLRIDPRSGEVVEDDIGVKSEGALDLGQGRLWLADRIDGTLRVFYINAGLISDAPILLGDSPADIAVGPRFVWAAVAGDGVIRRLPLASDSPGARTIRTGGRPDAMTVSKDAVWVVDSERESLLRIDRASGRLQGSPIPVDEDPAGVAVGKAAVWVTSAATDRVLRVVPR
jgi:serine/threonine-protein kinase